MYNILITLQKEKTEMLINLNGSWTLTCLPPHDTDMKSFTIPATVPGNVELDLFRAGIEPEPFYAENEYLFRKYEFCAWRFEKTRFVPEGFIGERVRLIFEGLNCIADIFVNTSSSATRRTRSSLTRWT